MKCRIFTLLFAFLAIAGNAVWGQNGSAESPVTIDISFMRTGGATTLPTGDGFTAIKGTTSGTEDGDQSNTLTITGGGYYKLTGGNSNIQIMVTATEPVYITLASGIHVDASLDNDLTNPLQDATAGIWENRCAMEIASGANVTLDWEGDCELSSGGLRAGINVKPNAILILKGTGSGKLYGTCWNNQDGIYTSGAGIGGDSAEPNFGTIIIESGTVEGRCLAQVPNWKSYGAGIGGGFKQGTPDPVENGTSSTSGTIIIKEGNVTGTANYDNTSLNIHTTGRSAAIGGGYKGTCTNIAILGGTINNNTATGNDADVIGVGEDYENGITNGIIIGQWNKDITPTLPDDIDINETNYFNGLAKPEDVVEGYKNKGEVTMPEGTQLYYSYPINEEAKFYAYNFKLDENMFAGEGSHSITSSTGYGNRKFYYYGANMSFTEGALSCSLNHLFLGWYDADATISIVPIKDNDNATFETSKNTPTSLTIYEYDAVWVDNEMDVTVRIGTTWAGQPGDHTPKVEYVPTNLDVSNLTFSLSTYDGNTAMPSEFKDLKFVGNKLQGKVNLQGDDTYKKIVIKAKVKLGNDGEEKETTINVVIVDEYMINTASVDLNKKHVYNGQLHNGTSGTEMDDWVLDVKMTKDIMDGTFVPNITLGANDVRAVKKCTNKMIDCHLMIENPANKVDWFIDAGADLIYIHPESERYVVKTLAHIKDRGILAGLAINPDTSVESIKEMLNLCDYILVMTVNPGFAGQKFVQFTKDKIIELVKLRKKYGYKIIIDGGCSPDVIKELSGIGCDGFVLGTSALFGKERSYKELIEELRTL